MLGQRRGIRPVTLVSYQMLTQRARRDDAAWRDLEADGWIARAGCVEVRVPMAAEQRMRYALAGGRTRFRVANTNPAARALVTGHYLDRLEALCGRAPRAADLRARTRTQARARDPLSRVSRGGHTHTVHEPSRELRARSAGGKRRDRRVGDVRLTAGGGAAPQPHPAAEAAS